MRLLLLFLLMAASANAQTPGNMTLLNSPEPTDDYCYENNIDKCGELGYTASGATETAACPDGGIACPFDDTRWNCTTWSCQDFNMYDPGYEPANAESCSTVEIKGRNCRKCSCSTGLNVPSCPKINALSTGAVTCAQMGYTQNITMCSDYLTCPSDSTKVHCLDQLCEETGCRAQVVVPKHAVAEEEERTCSCDPTKKKRVPVSWSTCEPGYERQVINGTPTCVEKSCATGLFEDDDINHCYGINAGAEYASGGGWSIAEDQANFTGLKKCYKCTCNCNTSTYRFVGAEKTQYEIYTEPCCSGARFKKCTRNCPTGLGTVLPLHAVVDTKETCTACGETSEYITAWRCPNGYVKQDDRCDIELCPANQAGSYYDTTFNSEADCRAWIYDGAEWTYVAEPKKGNTDEVIKSGESVCHKCYCQYFSDISKYKYTKSGSLEYMDLGELGCNGRYKTCAWSAKATEDHLTTSPDDAMGDYEEIVICDKRPFNADTPAYEHRAYRLQTCHNGYEPDAENISCHPKDCDSEGYILSTNPETGNTLAHADPCLSGTTTKYKLTACDDDIVNGIDYEILYNPQGFGLRCCNNNCPDGYELDKTCPAGESIMQLNDCGRRCIKCTH